MNFFEGPVEVRHRLTMLKRYLRIAWKWIIQNRTGGCSNHDNQIKAQCIYGILVLALWQIVKDMQEVAELVLCLVG